MALYRDEAEPRPFAAPARAFLRAVRSGLGREDAAARAGVALPEVGVWMRDEAFAQAFTDAQRRQGNRRVVINPAEVVGRGGGRLVAAPQERELQVLERFLGGGG